MIINLSMVQERVRDDVFAACGLEKSSVEESIFYNVLRDLNFTNI